jgi:hypothetical protein
MAVLKDNDGLGGGCKRTRGNNITRRHCAECAQIATAITAATHRHIRLRLAYLFVG